MQFEWDEPKNRINIEKHGVSFVEAIQAFLDPKRKIRFNAVHSANELRYYCFGQVDKRIMTVRFVTRKNKIRILGAGYWREGKKIYEKEP